jgi:hypothetical protein
MHEPIVEFLPSLVVLGTSVGAHWLVRMKAAVPTVGKAEPPSDDEKAGGDNPSTTVDTDT